MWKRFSRRANWLLARTGAGWAAHRSNRELKTAWDLIRLSGIREAQAAVGETIRSRLQQARVLNAEVL